MARHTRKLDKGFLGLPYRKRAADNWTLKKKGMTYEPLSVVEIYAHSPVFQVHGKEIPKMPELESGCNAHHSDSYLALRIAGPLGEATCSVYPRFIPSIHGIMEIRGKIGVEKSMIPWMTRDPTPCMLSPRAIT